MFKGQVLKSKENMKTTKPTEADAFLDLRKLRSTLHEETQRNFLEFIGLNRRHAEPSGKGTIRWHVGRTDWEFISIGKLDHFAARVCKGHQMTQKIAKIDTFLLRLNQDLHPDLVHQDMAVAIHLSGRGRYRHGAKIG